MTNNATERPAVFADLHARQTARIPRNRRLNPGPAAPVGDYGPAVRVVSDPCECGCPDCDDLIVNVLDLKTLEITAVHRPADWPVLVVAA